MEPFVMHTQSGRDLNYTPPYQFANLSRSASSISTALSSPSFETQKRAPAPNLQPEYALWPPNNTQSRLLRRCDSSESDPVFKARQCGRNRPRRSSRKKAERCDSSDSDPVFKDRARRSSRRRSENVESSDSDPVFKTLHTGAGCGGRKRKGGASGSRKKCGSKSGGRSDDSSSDECPVPPGTEPKRAKKSPSKNNKAGSSSSQRSPPSGSLIRNILCFLGLERRRQNRSTESKSRKSCNSGHVKVKTCQRVVRRPPDCSEDKTSSPRDRENGGNCNGPNQPTSNNCDNQKSRSGDGNGDKANSANADSVGDDHNDCKCSFCPLRPSETRSLDDILVTEETGNLIKEAIQDMLCQQLEERLQGVEEQIRKSEKDFWARYIPPSACPRCLSREGCLLHSSGQRKQTC